MPQPRKLELPPPMPDPEPTRAFELIERSPLPTLLVDVNSREILAVSAAAAELYGQPASALVGASIEHLDPDLASLPGPLGGPVPVVLLRREHVLSGGHRQPVDVVSERVLVDGRRAVRATIRPVGDAGENPVDLTRIHQAMAEVNRSALAADGEEAVWDEACRIVTETAGYRMASIATPRSDGILQVRIARGEVGDYLLDRRVDFSDPDATPTGRAAADRRTVVVEDLTDLPAANPNKSAALRNGYRSVCIIPLLDAEEVFGILAVFAGAPSAFDAGHVALLEQLAGDLGLVHAVRRQASARRATEERYRLLVERAVDGITLHAPDGRILDANPAACEFVGVARGELLDRRLEDFTDGLDVAWTERHWEDLQTGDSVSLEQRVRRPDGRLLTLDVRARLLPDGVIEAVIRDVTAQRELEAQLAQAAKMEAVGQLAGGIAHDFNNILTVIGGYASMLRSGLPEGSPLLADVGAILGATSRAQSLTSQLLAFGRRSLLEPQLVDVRSVVAEIEPMLRRLIGEDVTLETDLGEQRVPVSVDSGRLEHALVNLAVNARNAMPEGGRLRIAVRAEPAAETEPRDESWALITVEDSGVGMTPEVAARVFEPFYTTRPGGEGTGLGLAMVHGFLRQSGGGVRVASSPGHGTTFSLWLPLATGGEMTTPAGDPRVTPDRAVPRPPAGRTVLVVEDEPVLLRLAQRVLHEDGLEVLLAADGDEALRVATAHRGPIDLLLSDVVMPGMRGPALAEALRVQRPGLRVLLTSGYTEDDVERQGVSAGYDGFLAKPYTPDQLRAFVAAALALP